MKGHHKKSVWQKKRGRTVTGEGIVAAGFVDQEARRRNDYDSGDTGMLY